MSFLQILTTFFVTLTIVSATTLFTSANAAPASVFNDFPCGLGGGVPATNSHSVDTQSANSNTNLRCEGNVAPTQSGHAVVDKDFACGAGGLTFDSHSVTTPNGKKIISCHNNNK